MKLPLSHSIATLLVLAAGPAALAQAPAKVTYNDHVLPIFRNACLNCHNPDKKKAGLDLSTYTGAVAGSENGPVILSGNPGGSLLFKCVKGTEEPKMPPKGDRLTDAELGMVEKWIAGQLLESASSKGIAAASNNVQVAVVSLTKPDGPPPMPGELPMEPLVRTTRSNALVALAASPWAPVVAVGGQKQIVLYHTETLEPLGVLPFPEGFPAIIRFSRNGQLLLTGGGQGGKSGKVVLWDIKTGERIATVGNEFDQVLGADLSPDQQFVALGGPNKVVKIYSTKDGKLLHTMKKHTDWVTAVAYSPDGKYLATSDRNGGIVVWEGSTGKEFNTLPGHKVMVTALAFMTGVVASASEDGKVSLWDVKENKEIKSWTAHAGGAAWVDFSPDGRLVSCGRDKIAKAWDQTGKELGKMTEPFADIALRVALSSERIIAGDWTGDIRVCSLDGKLVGKLTANPPGIADHIAAAQKQLAEAQAARAKLQEQFVAAEQKVKAEEAATEDKAKAAVASLDAAKSKEAPVATATPAAAATNVTTAELQKKADAQTAEIAKLREVRATKGAGTPEYAEADGRVQAKKAELETTRKALAAAQASPAAPATPAPAPAAVVAAAPAGSPAAQEMAKAKAALEQADQQIAAAKAALEKWKMARLFQTVHNARQALAEKQSRYEDLLQAAKEALLPIEKVNADIVAAEKAIAEAPAKVQEGEKLLADARAAIETNTKAVMAAEAELTSKEAAVKALAAVTPNAAGTADELKKKLEVQTAEAAKLREVRSGKTAGTPEYAEADAKVQAKKVEIAQTEAALAGAKPPVASGENPELKAAQADVAKAREALEKSRAETKALTEKAAGAEKALANAQKQASEAQQQLASLRKEAPQITKSAQAAKVELERAVAAAEKELAAAKADVDKQRADYESIKNGGTKAAALAVPPSKS